MIRRFFSSKIAKMVVRHHATNYEEFQKIVGGLENEGLPIHVLVSGNKQEDGTSWCPYCQKAAPVIEKALETAPENSHFIKIELDKPYWKDPNNQFRKNPNFKCTFVPTLLRWKSPQRLDGDQCSNPDLVEMLFTDETD